MHPALFVCGALIIGFASGLRTFTPLALVSWVATWGWMPLAGSRLTFLGSNMGATIVSVLAVVELIGDKLPTIPSRLTLGPLGGRLVTASMAAAALSIGLGQPWIVGVICGAIGSVAGAMAGFHTRRAIVRRLRIADWIIAIVEDLVTFGLALLVLAVLF